MLKNKSAKKAPKKVAKQHKKPTNALPRRNITTTSTSKSLTRTKLNGFGQQRTSLTGPLFAPAMQQSQLTAPKPSLFTQSVAFAPTSKRWNKKRSQSAVNKQKRSWLRQRYHGSNYMDPYPTMTMAKFVRLPRPLFIESETIDLFLPAPQVEHLATPQSFSQSAMAAQQPY